MEKEIVVTKHALRRLKERVGLNRKACIRQAKRAFVQGDYMKGRDGKDLRLYGGHIYVFSGLYLITVLERGFTKNQSAHLKKRKERHVRIKQVQVNDWD